MHDANQNRETKPAAPRSSGSLAPEPVSPMQADDFLPAPGLRAPLLQSTLASLRLRNRRALRHPMATGAVARVLDCGDGVRLQAWFSPPPRRQRGDVVLIHGWEGCHESVYLMSAACALHDAGWRVVRLNLRDHGATHHLNEAMFHSGRMDEVFGALQAIGARLRTARLRVVGFSLGGNFAVRIGLQAPARSAPVAQAVAICPALDPLATLQALDTCPTPIRRYFLGKWRRTLANKAAAWPGRYDFSPFETLTSFVEITRCFVENHTEFDRLEDYVASYDLTQPLPLADGVPISFITAQDDPVVPWSAFAALSAQPEARLIATRFGGHCGFIENLAMSSWINRRILHELDGATEPAGSHAPVLQPAGEQA